jgi:multisubunit Na+/H+ antiporter MnhB subunit
MSELLELLHYLTGFWRFTFNRNFRSSWISQFKKKSISGKSLELLNAFIATTVGLGVPAIVGVIIYGNIIFPTKVDTCLDAGGSYNYQNCSCDFEQSHQFHETHQCK